MPVVRIEVAGKSIDIEDIPMSTFAKVEKETGVSWLDLLSRPLAHAGASSMLVEEAAGLLGVECPALTPRTLIDAFAVDDGESRPEAYKDGLPLSEGETSTG